MKEARHKRSHVHDSLYMKCPEIHRQKAGQCLPGAGDRQRLPEKGYGGIWVLVGDGNVLYIDCGDGYKTVHICQNSQTCTLKQFKIYYM